MNKPTVGQIVYSLNIGNAARGKEQRLTPMVVTKIGRKLFHCVPKEYPNWNPIPFFLDSWMHDAKGYSPDYKLFETEQDWLDSAESDAICRFIATTFEYGHNRAKLPVTSLRAIRDIIKSNSA